MTRGSHVSAIGTYITAWLENKGLRKKDIAAAMGYSTIDNGIRRLNSVMGGQIADDLFMEKLRRVLGTSEDEFKTVVEATRSENQEEEKRRAPEKEAAAQEVKRCAAQTEAANRSAFKPHIYILFNRNAGCPLFAFMGIERKINLPLPADIASWPESEQVLQARKIILEQHEFHCKILEGRGQIAGYCFRRMYDEAVEFELRDGVPEISRKRENIKDSGRTHFLVLVREGK